MTCWTPRGRSSYTNPATRPAATRAPTSTTGSYKARHDRQRVAVSTDHRRSEGVVRHPALRDDELC